MSTGHGILLGMVCGALIFSSAHAGESETTACDPSGNGAADPAASSKDIRAGLRPFPAEAQESVDALFAFMAATNAAFSPGAFTALVEFVSAACREDSAWELPPREGADGSACVMKLGLPVRQYIALNFHPGIPDYAIFPTALRYSTCIDPEVMRGAYACIGAGPTGTQEYVTGRIMGMEAITPNPESGSYFSYTNSRTFLRCRIAERDVLFSWSEMTAPSTFSHRGVPVGPRGQALFYYSEKPGLNLAGMTWMASRITRSTTLSVYLGLGSNETAVASFAWLRAGWKGVNVIQARHILNTQKTTLDFSRQIAQHPEVSIERLAAIIAGVDALADHAVNANYEKYLAYIRQWRDNGRKGFFFRGNLLKDLYSSHAAQTIPLPYRRALIVQERIRALLGTPTWSADQTVASLAR